MIHKRKLRMGMVGGGQGAFIGAVHRMAANIDGEIELVCGAFSSNHQKSIDSGQALHLDSSRCYANYEQMLVTEASLDKQHRIDFVAIVTPNHLHFAIAKMALELGFHVICDKPATFNLEQTLTLSKIIEQSNCLYALTHTYNGYPLVKKAKELVAKGDLGKITKVVVEYSQGWLAANEDETSKQASWRLDPKQAGISCCMGDIGVHAANLAEYISGSTINKLCAQLNSIVPGRILDDDGTVLLQFDNQAFGVLIASQVAVGEENNLNIRIYGDKASISWQQQDPNSLWFKQNNYPAQLIRTGVGQFSSVINMAIRTPAGHPEGYLEAFANIYKNFCAQIRHFQQHGIASNGQFDVPGIEQAIRGMAFIENVVSASESNIKWHNFSLTPNSTNSANKGK